MERNVQQLISRKSRSGGNSRSDHVQLLELSPEHYLLIHVRTAKCYHVRFNYPGDVTCVLVASGLKNNKISKNQGNKLAHVKRVNENVVRQDPAQSVKTTVVPHGTEAPILTRVD